MSSSPRLPVPDLNETCQRYLQQVRVLLDDAAYQKTEAVTRYFRSRKAASCRPLCRRLIKKQKAAG